MSRDEHKRQFKGYRKGGAICPCCRETSKRKETRLARRRLRQADRAGR
jgi:hypothetical protein